MNDVNNEVKSSPEAKKSKLTSSSWTIPLAIIIGFGFIAASIYFGDGGGSNAVSDRDEVSSDDTEELVALDNINPITEEDHIRGNPNAPLVIVEYSDYDCAFCKSFHNTMKKVMEEYGANGQVAWVYRHFPLTSLHPSAAHLAEASECVAELGGNESFWTFSDLVFSERGTNELTNIARLPEFAEISGVDRGDFQKCLDEGSQMAKVEEDRENAVSTGGRGTPHSIIVVGGQHFPINGAQPYDVVKQMIDGLLQ